MTKVDIKLKLIRPLSDPEMKSLAHVHAVYGMLTVRLTPTGDELFVEYDASRLSPDEVRGTLAQHGIPIA
jgi:hypothetical protein